ncbi:hypothetical protein GF394_03790 [Candidatus Fermentibacteria bacterium]|nr:hypothetical protein [Candidatus Fermentibacteria bacterium]
MACSALISDTVVSTRFSDERFSETPFNSPNGVVATYEAVAACMGLDYDPVNDWFWQTSENNGLTVTVDPSDGSFTPRFYLFNVPGLEGLFGNGLYYDWENTLLYIADYLGDGGTTYFDAIYCLDVSDPYNPSLVDSWDLNIEEGILGITYRAPYFYCTFYSGSLKVLSLSPGGAFTIVDECGVYGLGGIDFDPEGNVFYTHSALSDNVRVLSGSNPETEIDSFDAGTTLGSGMALSPSGYLWGSYFDTEENYVLENTFTDLSRNSWAAIKVLYMDND